MSRLKMLMGMLFLFVVVSMFTSCTSDEENFSALNEEKEFVFKAESSKTQFVSDLKQMFEAISTTRSNEKYELSEKQITFLQNSAVAMLKDEGVFTDEMSKLLQKKDGSVIFIGALYLGMVDNASTNGNFINRHKFKTRSESTECYSVAKLQSCIHSCIGKEIGADIIKAILNGYVGYQCLTKMLVKTILKRVAGALISGGISLTVDLTFCTLECMGIL